MNLYVGQELDVYCGATYLVTITEIIKHKNETYIKSFDQLNNLTIVFNSTAELRLHNYLTYIGEIINDVEVYLPNLTFCKPSEANFIIISLGDRYGDKYFMMILNEEIIKDTIRSKEDYIDRYGGMLKLLNLYETYEKRIDHIIKTLVLLLHFDLTNKEKICN